MERLDVQKPFELLESFARRHGRHAMARTFHTFTALQILRVSRKLRSIIVSTLQGLHEETVTEVLAAVDDLYLEGYQASGLEQQDVEPFITAPRCSGHPVAIHNWETEVVPPNPAAFERLRRHIIIIAQVASSPHHLFQATPTTFATAARI
jgi:hypothetical protein